MKRAQSFYMIPSGLRRLFEPWGTCLSQVITNTYPHIIAIAFNQTKHTVGSHCYFSHCVKQTDKTYVAGASARDEEFGTLLSYSQRLLHVGPELNAKESVKYPQKAWIYFICISDFMLDFTNFIVTKGYSGIFFQPCSFVSLILPV